VSDGPAPVAVALTAVRRRLEQAARAAGREPSAIRLVAVSKTFPPDAVREAAIARQVDFGENKVQEGLQKIADTRDLSLRWHLIGHLQSNKARRAAASFHAIHSIDSLDLLRRVDAAAADAGTAPEVFVQVDLAGELTKFGTPEPAVQALFEAPLRAARLVGLMLLPPWTDNPEDARSWFRRLRELRDGLAARGIPPDRLRELSMGMSHDFEVAVQEGSTLVRIGTAIFGTRAPHARQEATG
jgi:PLP dependent protein